jgi:hypothetical protein
MTNMAQEYRIMLNTIIRYTLEVSWVFGLVRTPLLNMNPKQSNSNITTQKTSQMILNMNHMNELKDEILRLKLINGQYKERIYFLEKECEQFKSSSSSTVFPSQALHSRKR